MTMGLRRSIRIERGVGPIERAEDAEPTPLVSPSPPSLSTHSLSTPLFLTHTDMVSRFTSPVHASVSAPCLLCPRSFLRLGSLSLSLIRIRTRAAQRRRGTMLLRAWRTGASRRRQRRQGTEQKKWIVRRERRPARGPKGPNSASAAAAKSWRRRNRNQHPKTS